MTFHSLIELELEIFSFVWAGATRPPWRWAFDPESQEEYFFRMDTMETSWERPTVCPQFPPSLFIFCGFRLFGTVSLLWTFIFVQHPQFSPDYVSLSPIALQEPIGRPPPAPPAKPAAAQPSFHLDGGGRTLRGKPPAKPPVKPSRTRQQVQEQANKVC